MDSQAKYGALARGDASLYLRVPTRFSGGMVYEEKIWDHASGWLLVKEAGGEVGDCWGRDLDFGRGRTLKGNDVSPSFRFVSFPSSLVLAVDSVCSSYTLGSTN